MGVYIICKIVNTRILTSLCLTIFIQNVSFFPLVLDHAPGLTHRGTIETGTTQEFTKIVIFVVTIEVIGDHTISGLVEEVFIHEVSIIVVDM